MFKKYFLSSDQAVTATSATDPCPAGLWVSAEQQRVQALRLAEQSHTAAEAHQAVTTLPETSAHAASDEQLHIRVIALENLVITLLATASDHQLDCAREMAAYIAPRPGATQHPLTIRAAEEMVSMVDRAMHFRATARS